MAGPDPRELIDPIPMDAFRREIRTTMHDWAKEILSDSYPMIYSTWGWSFVVLMYCRMLHSLYVGRIESKLMGARFGKVNFDPRWHALIDRALQQRPGQYLKIEAADSADVEQTLAFLRYVLDFEQNVTGFNE